MENNEPEPTNAETVYRICMTLFVLAVGIMIGLAL